MLIEAISLGKDIVSYHNYVWWKLISLADRILKAVFASGDSVMPLCRWDGILSPAMIKIWSWYVEPLC